MLAVSRLLDCFVSETASIASLQTIPKMEKKWKK